MVEILNNLFRVFWEWAAVTSLGDFLRAIVSGLASVAMVAVLTGCAPDSEPLERMTNRGFDVVQSVAEKAIAETSTRTAYLSGGVEGIEPGYRVDFGGGMFNGFIGWMEARARGVSGRLSGHAQTDQGEPLPDERPVGSRDHPATLPATQPVLSPD